MTEHTYEIFTRQGITPFARTGISRQWSAFSYTKRYQAGGTFTLSLPDEAPELPRLLPGNIIEITRDGITDFFGFVTGVKRHYDEKYPATAIAQFKGLDLTAWVLRQRIALPPIATQQVQYYGNTGPAESVLQAMLLDHFTSPTDATRIVSNLGNATAHSPLLGDPVTINLRGEKWDAAAANIALAGNVGYRIWLNEVPAAVVVSVSGVTGVMITNQGFGYSIPPFITFIGGGGTGAAGFAVMDTANNLLVGVTITESGHDYTSAPTLVITTVIWGSGAAGTVSIGTVLSVVPPALELQVYTGANHSVRQSIQNAVVFNPNYRDLLQFDYELDLEQLENHLYTMGGDSSTTNRFFVEDENASSVAAWGRWEALVDGQNAYTEEIAHSEAQVYLAPKTSVERITFKPKETAQSQYLQDWVLGDTVTVTYPTFGVDVDLPIVEIKVGFTRTGGESLEISTSMLAPDVLRQLRRMVQSTQAAQFAPSVVQLPRFAGDAAVPTTPPPVTGTSYYDTLSNTMRVFDGSAWQVVTSGGVVNLPNFAVDPGVPAAVVGTAYFDTLTNTMQVWDGVVWRTITWT